MTEHRDPHEDFDDELTEPERNEMERRARVQKLIQDTRERLREVKK